MTESTAKDESPCGRKAEWFVIGDMLDDGSDFVVTCRECYKKGLGRFRDTADDLVPAVVFKEEIGRDPLCGDEESLGFWEAFNEATKTVSEEQLTKREFARWLKERDLYAHIHRVAVYRRLQRLESSIGLLAEIAAVGLAKIAADQIQAWYPQGGRFLWWSSAIAVGVVIWRLISWGRLRKHLKVR